MTRSSSYYTHGRLGSIIGRAAPPILSYSRTQQSQIGGCYSVIQDWLIYGFYVGLNIPVCVEPCLTEVELNTV